MSAFDLHAELSGDAAFRLVAPSFVRLFWRTSVLDTVVATLREQGYQVVRLDASTWPSEADLHRDIAAALHFPDYYGHNLNALNDCLSDVVTYDYGTTPDATGLVLVFTGYDTFSRHCPGQRRSSWTSSPARPAQRHCSGTACAVWCSPTTRPSGSHQWARRQ